jgi:hypothetical protein
MHILDVSVYIALFSKVPGRKLQSSDGVQDNSHSHAKLWKSTKIMHNLDVFSASYSNSKYQTI